MPNNKIPNIRFKGFDQEWEEAAISSKASFSKGKGYSKADIEQTGEPLLLYGSLYTDYKTNINDVTTFAKKKEGSVVSTGKEVVVPASGETAEDIARASAIHKDGIILGGDLNVITADDSVDKSYLALELTYGKSHNKLVKKAQGISVVHLHNSDIQELDILFPDPAEQQKIGTFFATLDDLIAAKEQELEKLRQLKAALLQQMFPSDENDNTNRVGYNDLIINQLDKLNMTISTTPNTPRIRFKGFTEPWERKRLDELFVLRNGYTPSKANPSFWTNGTIPWFRMDDIREQGHILKDSSQHITPEAVKGSGLFPAGCVIMSTTATIGEHALIIADSLANQRFTVLQTVNRWETLDMMYFYHYCFILGDWCRKNVNVGGLNAVNITDMKQHKIPYPSMEEQKKIAAFLTAQEDKVKESAQQITKLKTIKQALLQKMFAA